MKRIKTDMLGVDPDTPIDFSFQGRQVTGCSGDTIATALYAAGVRIFSRSLKYHRPRGLYSLDGESANTYVNVDKIPNVCAETTELTPGMAVFTQNAWPDAERDLLGFMDYFHYVMPAGFYYRCFHKPARAWPLFARMIRKAAGTGRLALKNTGPGKRMSGNHDQIFIHTDICVIGAGPAGLSAALAAADKALDVVILEKRPVCGGFFAYQQASWDRVAALARAAVDHPRIRVMTRTACTGVYGRDRVTAVSTGRKDQAFDTRHVEITTRMIISAAGCIERPLLFDNNERPGVMQPGCAHRLLNVYGILPGRRIVVATGHDYGLKTAVSLYDGGADIRCAADIRYEGQDPELMAALEKRGIPFLRAWPLIEARGRKRVGQAVLSPASGRGQKIFSCDTIAASAGFTPVTGPFTMAGARLAWDGRTGFFLPQNPPGFILGAGRMYGWQDLEPVMASGKLAGLKAAYRCKKKVKTDLARAQKDLDKMGRPPAGNKRGAAPGKGNHTFICFDEDARLKTVDQAVRDGFDLPELAKRYAAVGTGPGQWGIPGHNLPLYMAEQAGDAHLSHGPTRIRPPFVPVLLATYAGSGHHMCKQTPLEGEQTVAGGIMEQAGEWRRARYFSKDLDAAAEIKTVRNRVGLIDVSTLGKFRIFGPDAVKALDRVYVGCMDRLSDERVTYCAMCNPDGCLIDDGLIVKTGTDDYYFTTSTGRAGRTIEWIRYQTRTEPWTFYLVNLTDHFGALNLTGPKAPKVLARILGIPLSDEIFPYMGFREYRIQNRVPVRIMRLGFTGELSFELHIPASWLAVAADLIFKAGKEFGICWCGLEAQNCLRMEKGHIIIGSESEQRTTLHDLGLGFLWDRNKADPGAVGMSALARTQDQPGRLKLTGFEMTSGIPPRDGSIIVDRQIMGHVCTARYSAALDKAVGMALVEESLSPVGTILHIYEDDCKGALKEARVVPMPFYDPEARRQQMEKVNP